MAQDAVTYALVAIGGSAGSLEVVMNIVAGLPLASGAAFVVVLHRKNDAESILAGLLAAKTKMPVKEVEDKEQVLPNHVYVAPPDYHLLLENKATFALDASEKIHYSRPSIDVTFESVAEVYSNHALGILLSGANADGAAGLKRIRQNGGFALVQNPDSAEVGYMPRQAINLEAYDKVLHAHELTGYVQRLLLAGK